jgi:GrpB-like predicted nucleotidyltransferase (UPF0157 family)
MSNPRDRKALARKKAEAMERFLRDYDDYCDQARFWTKKAEAAEPDVQYLLNLETDDDA